MSKFLQYYKNFIDGSVEVVNKKTRESLGLIEFNKKWRKWCFYPENETWFDSECLDDISLRCKEKDKETIKEVL